MVKNNRLWAIEIKSIPVLTGKDAERFVKVAEQNYKNKSNGLTKKESEKLKKFLEKSRNFTFN